MPDTTRSQPSRRAWGWLLAACVLLVIVMSASVALGVRAVAPGDILAALEGHIDTVSRAAVAARLPRTVLAVILGAALALSGASMQAVTRNPLADPGILGVTAGAALAVVIGIAFVGISRPETYIAVAIAGAGGGAIAVYAIGSLGRGGPTPLKLALAGAALSAAFASLTSAILLPRVDVMEAFRFWQIGGVGGATWERIGVILPAVVMGAVAIGVSARSMNALALGDDIASGLGTRVATTRLFATCGAVVLAGSATAIAGPIAFVGLVVPHMCRYLVGTNHARLLPLVAVVGACLLVASDVVGRVIARPEEIPVGIITAFVGAPLFVWLVRRQKVREL